ncbi:KTSC domain-containing protein [Agromyces silvae]|uniref:KTSC domain-containing protein n=1 Tax=Agromyces silvae TaxID=3388266 RepID=UPI00280BE3BA|nr:KTSC domain-containing protein [Agromyces protaetiae]
MERTAVESSNVISIGYQPDTLTMEMEFKGGNVYQYFDVPEHVFDGIIRAPSVGRFFHEQVRGIYRYARV